MQLESLASFSAVIDRLGEFEEVVNAPKAAQAAAAQPGIDSGATAADAAGSSAAASAAASTAAGGTAGAADNAALPAAAAAGAQPQSEAARAALEAALGERIQIVDVAAAAGSTNSSGGGGGDVLLELEGVTLRTPDGSATLVQDLDLQVSAWRRQILTTPTAGAPEAAWP